MTRLFRVTLICVGCVALLAQPARAESLYRHALPLVLAAFENSQQQSVVRIINRSGVAGNVSIEAIDDTGEHYGPVDLSIEANQTIQFTSDELELGNALNGLPVGVGNGSGHWRLDLQTDLDIQPLAYFRGTDGFLTDMYAVVPKQQSVYHVLVFNPGSDTTNVSMLRLINPGEETAFVAIAGLDEQGNPPPGGGVTLLLGAGESLTLTAQQLESGDGGVFFGSLEDGEGTWQLFVLASVPKIWVMNLMVGQWQQLSNLSMGVPDQLGGLCWQPEQPSNGLGVSTWDPPSDFDVRAGINSAVLWWKNPFQVYENHARTLIYRHTANEFGNAELIGTSPSVSYVDRQVSSNTTYFYWIRWESDTSVLGPPTAGFEVSTSVSPSEALAQVNQDILNDPFTQDLLALISQNDGIPPIDNSVFDEVRELLEGEGPTNSATEIPEIDWSKFFDPRGLLERPLPTNSNYPIPGTDTPTLDDASATACD